MSGFILGDGLVAEVVDPILLVTEVAAPAEATVLVLPQAGPAGPPGAGAFELQQHIDNSLPHPAYDDIPTLTLIFNNGLV